MTTLRSLLLATAVAASVGAMPDAARAISAITPVGPPTTTTYDFVGQCTDCYAGEGAAEAQLTLEDYTPGNAVDSTNFVSFTYDGTDLQAAFTILPDDVLTLEGAIGPGLPGPFDFTIEDNARLTFTSGLDGSWNVSILPGNGRDYGSSSSWSAAPEPVSASLLGTALLGLGMARRARRSPPRG